MIYTLLVFVGGIVAGLVLGAVALAAYIGNEIYPGK